MKNLFLVAFLLSGVASASYISKQSSPLTTKGDLYTHSATANARLPVGTNGQILTADSSQALGVKWATAGSGTGNITDINSDATPAQTLTVGTSGTDFAIVDNGTGGHAFNLPTASASNRGALSTTDWSTFNNKVDGKGNGSANRVCYWTDANTVSSSSTFTWTPATFQGVMTGSNSGGNVQLQISNTSNTASSNAILRLDMANTSGGDAQIKYARNGSTLVSEGYDNSTDLWTLSNSSTLGTNNMMTVSTAGVVNLPGLTASKVAVTDSSKNLASSTMSQTTLEGLTVEQLDGFVETPSNKTYVLRVKAKYAGTINEVSLKTASGTITAKLQIGGVDVTSCTSISVTSTASTTSCTAANTFASGDTITLITTSNSSAADLQWSVKVTRS